METPDLEVIIPSEDPTVATRPFVHLCDPTAVTLHFISAFHAFGTSQFMKLLLVLEHNTFHQFLVILLAHLFCHYSFL